MSIEGEARDKFRRSEEFRVEKLRHFVSAARALNEAAKRVIDRDHDLSINVLEFQAPHQADLALEIDWGSSGVVLNFADDPIELYAQVLDEGDGERRETATVEIYAIGACRICGQRTPLAPSVTDFLGLGRALEADRPVDQHRCVVA